MYINLMPFTFCLDFIVISLISQYITASVMIACPMRKLIFNISVCVCIKLRIGFNAALKSN